jgi:hypothetical protein
MHPTLATVLDALRDISPDQRPTLLGLEGGLHAESPERSTGRRQPGAGDR